MTPGDSGRRSLPFGRLWSVGRQWQSLPRQVRAIAGPPKAVENRAAVTNLGDVDERIWVPVHPGASDEVLTSGSVIPVPAMPGLMRLVRLTSKTSGGLHAELSQGQTAAPLLRPVTACSQLASPGDDFSNPDAPTVILSANQVTLGGAPPFCDVSGYIAPQEQFQLSPPVTGYAGVYLQQGCGGFCGERIADPVAAGGDCAGAKDTAMTKDIAVNNTESNLAGVMATGTDDQGQTGGENDAFWAKEDPAPRVSFGYTSEHALAQATKAILAAYYGRPPRYSFYDGCSGGGRAALVEAQRYPCDFNGILAGAPGNIEAQLLGVVAA